MKIVLFLLPWMLALAPAAVTAAMPTISCHCFQDRSYDAARPAAVDPYLLASTQNSFLAAVYGLEKKHLVRERMAGTPGETLWVAHYVAEGCQVPAARLLAAHAGSGGSWQAAAGNCAAGRLGVRFAALLQENVPEAVLAAAAVDELVAARLGAAPEAIRQIRTRGGTNAELILAAYLARKGGSSPAELHAEVAAGRATWGQTLERAGGAPASIEEELRRMTR